MRDQTNEERLMHVAAWEVCDLKWKAYLEAKDNYKDSQEAYMEAVENFAAKYVKP